MPHASTKSLDFRQRCPQVHSCFSSAGEYLMSPPTGRPSEPRPHARPRRSHTNLRDRYDLRGAIEPANGRGLPPCSRNAFTALVAVEDPLADPSTGRKGRLIATVNRRVDIL